LAVDKKNIKKAIDAFIRRCIQEDEVWLASRDTDDRRALQDDITGLDLYLSDVTEALATNDFEPFEDDAERFIKSEFPRLGLDKSDPAYKYFIREYLKAYAYIIRTGVNHRRGHYELDEITDWMPDHLTELNKYDVSKPLGPLALARDPGRPGIDYDYIRTELKRLHTSGETTGLSRTKICELLADQYNKKPSRSIKSDSIRKELKPDFDKLGI